MKNYLGIIALLALLIASCTGDSTGINIPCETPTNFTITDYNNLVEVSLGWGENEEEGLWKIEYGLHEYTQGEGNTATTETNSITINGLDFNAAYDFYIRTKCDDGFSDWIGPVTNTPEETSASNALMTANIKGVQYDYMVPFLWQTFTDNAVSISHFGGDPYLKIQGNSTPQDVTLENSKEINIFIPESDWAVGTYNLAAEGGAGSNVNLVYRDINEEDSQAFEGDNGILTITEFNLEERVIRGTFEFTFTQHFVGTGDIEGPFQVLNGTFDYSLDDEFFD